MPKKAICVTSGGMDSIAMGLACIEDGYEITYLHADLAQKAEGPENEAVRLVSDWLKVPYIIIDIGWLGKIGKSSLTDANIPIPNGMDSIIESTQIVRDPSQTLWTPARNVVLLAAASAYAEAQEAELITWGANQSETAYPDNTMEFADRFSYMLEMGCLKPAKVTAPLYKLDKPEMILWTYRHGYEKVYDFTWSCDRGIKIEDSQLVLPHHTLYRKFTPCGECGCCMNRRLAFMIAHNTNEFVIDRQVYNNPEYFEQVFLPDLAKRCTSDMWMDKYLKIKQGGIYESNRRI